jgi:hypothetical protein
MCRPRPRTHTHQDFAIECPATGSTFSLKDGAIVDWYPNNYVLAALTPPSTCRNMDVYPVRLAQVRGVFVCGSLAAWVSLVGLWLWLGVVLLPSGSWPPLCVAWHTDTHPLPRADRC